MPAEMSKAIQRPGRLLADGWLVNHHGGTWSTGSCDGSVMPGVGGWLNDAGHGVDPWNHRVMSHMVDGGASPRVAEI